MCSLTPESRLDNDKCLVLVVVTASVDDILRSPFRLTPIFVCQSLPHPRCLPVYGCSVYCAASYCRPTRVVFCFPLHSGARYGQSDNAPRACLLIRSLQPQRGFGTDPAVSGPLRLQYLKVLRRSASPCYASWCDISLSCICLCMPSSCWKCAEYTGENLVLGSMITDEDRRSDG